MPNTFKKTLEVYRDTKRTKTILSDKNSVFFAIVVFLLAIVTFPLYEASQECCIRILLF